MQDLTRLTDPEFMAEAERLRDEIERQGDEARVGLTGLADLRRRYEELAAEFDRRVRKMRSS